MSIWLFARLLARSCLARRHCLVGCITGQYHTFERRQGVALHFYIDFFYYIILRVKERQPLPPNAWAFGFHFRYYDSDSTHIWPQLLRSYVILKTYLMPMPAFLYELFDVSLILRYYTAITCYCCNIFADTSIHMSLAQSQPLLPQIYQVFLLREN